MQGIIWGTTRGTIKGNTKSLDYGSYQVAVALGDLHLEVSSSFLSFIWRLAVPLLSTELPSQHSPHCRACMVCGQNSLYLKVSALSCNVCMYIPCLQQNWTIEYAAHICKLLENQWCEPADTLKTWHMTQTMVPETGRPKLNMIIRFLHIKGPQVTDPNPKAAKEWRTPATTALRYVATRLNTSRFGLPNWAVEHHQVPKLSGKPKKESGRNLAQGV